jgi:pyridoxine/pyridoxamine 5'-phosphate oxidase
MPNQDRGLRESDLGPDPIVAFERWLADARAAGGPLPEAVALATAGATGAPSVRHVLLRGLDERGFVFFTNYESRKGRELAANPRAALAFHWPQLYRQVTLTGDVERVSREAGVPLTVVDVDADTALREWSDHVPVVLIDGVIHSRWWVEEPALRKALR